LPASLLDLVKAQLAPELVGQLAGAIGQDPAATRRAVEAAAPTLLAGAAQTAVAPGGADRLIGLIRELGGRGDILASFASLLGSGSTDQLLALGRPILSALFGNRADSIAGAVASQAGVPASSATSLLTTVAPLVMGILGRQVSQRGLSAGGLASLLSAEAPAIARALPSALSSTLGSSLETAARGTSAAARGVAAGASPLRRLIPLALLLLAGLIFYDLVRAPKPLPPVGAPPPASALTLPGGAQLAVRANSIEDQLARYFAGGAGELPKRFVFDDLNFDFGTSEPTTTSRATIDNLAVILRAYPSATIVLVGHTDNTGDSGANQQLSLARANAVKALLVRDGVADARIATQGLGADQPLASNDTDEGRALNRRTELVVTAR
jgi:outer membrane protein OmpA-like peptidoglycan-associated protein